MTETQTEPISERAVETLPNQIVIEAPEPDPDWFITLHHRYSLATSIALIVVVCGGLVGLTLATILNQINTESEPEQSLDRFWINQVIKYTSIP